MLPILRNTSVALLEARRMLMLRLVMDAMLSVLSDLCSLFLPLALASPPSVWLCLARPSSSSSKGAAASDVSERIELASGARLASVGEAAPSAACRLWLWLRPLRKLERREAPMLRRPRAFGFFLSGAQERSSSATLESSRSCRLDDLPAAAGVLVRSWSPEWSEPMDVVSRTPCSAGAAPFHALASSPFACGSWWWSWSSSCLSWSLESSLGLLALGLATPPAPSAPPTGTC